MPTAWLNVRAFMDKKPAPLLNPTTLKPMTAEELSDVFCYELAKQEVDDTTPYIEIPEEIRNFYKMYRPSPLVRAYCLEEKLGTPAFSFALGGQDLGKGFADIFAALDADIFCLQETKMQPGQADFEVPGYYQYWYSAQKKGYSGTAVFTKHRPLSVRYGMGIEEHDKEGRVITAEFENCFVVTCYTPNSQNELRRLDYRMEWEDDLREYLMSLDKVKPVIYCGDLNVAHQEIDLKNPSSNRGNAGFSDEERGAFSALLADGFTDSFRHLFPDQTGAYTWWSYMFNARANNAGWRIDYFVVSDRLAPAISDALIYPQITGSDHCPVEVEIDF